MTCQVSRDLARFDAQISREQRWDAAVERLTENGIACDRKDPVRKQKEEMAS